MRALPPILVCVLVAACGNGEPASPEPTVTELAGRTMGTTWKVLVPGDSVPALTGLQVAIVAELERVNAQMSHYRDDSEITRFNEAAPGAWFPVSREFATTCSLARSVHRRSGGAFDVTVGPLVDLWGFGAGSGGRRRVPDDEELATARSRVGDAHLAVRGDPPALQKDIPGLELDLSAIAKGHGVDRVADLLRRRGVTAYFVEIGGEVRTGGRKAAAVPWRVAIEEPRKGGRAVHSVVPLEDGALATSGDYRNFWAAGGRRYSHTLDPRTGRPVTHALASVSVVAPTCAEADAWATALLVLGPEEGPARAAREGLAALFLVRDGGGFSARTTPGWPR